mmetsp:Transcript_16494/g.53837  ORF Transcript_16494/g.53837 Transcript_16494/m.53837 type:complete len:221 (-) Transcript_16494:1053-1715(-)
MSSTIISGFQAFTSRPTSFRHRWRSGCSFVSQPGPRSRAGQARPSTLAETRVVPGFMALDRTGHSNTFPTTFSSFSMPRGSADYFRNSSFPTTLSRGRTSPVQNFTCIMTGGPNGVRRFSGSTWDRSVRSNSDGMRIRNMQVRCTGANRRVTSSLFRGGPCTCSAVMRATSGATASAPPPPSSARWRTRRGILRDSAALSHFGARLDGPNTSSTTGWSRR